MFNREKRGKYFIQLCGTTPCMICGSGHKKSIMEYADTDGQTSADGLFTLLEVECLGACANAPMVQMNDDYYECLTPESTIALLDVQGRQSAEMGKGGSLPMNGQVSAGPAGKRAFWMARPRPPPCATTSRERWTPCR